MKLISIVLYNFRQFYGLSPRIEIAGGDRNVTVFHGVNGAGKTALLNAFTWVLYGRFTHGFKQEDQLVNRRAIREASKDSTVDVWVELQFKHAERLYTLKKKAMCRVGHDVDSESTSSEVTTLQFCDDSGELNIEKNHIETIGRILPEDLHHYFFFDGERIERLVQPTSNERANLSRAAKKLMRVEILERAEKHLERARAELQGELKGVGTSQTDDLINLRNQDESKLKSLHVRSEEIRCNIENLKKQSLVIGERLHEVEQVREFQEERERLKEKEIGLKNDQASNRLEMVSEIGRDGYTVFLGDSIVQFRELLSTLRSKGELPTGIKRQFVDDLLERGECVCGRSLLPDSEPWSHVFAFRGKVGMDGIDETAFRLSGQSEDAIDRAKTFWERITRSSEKTRRIRGERARVESELDRIGDKILHAPGEEGPALERRLKDTDAKLREQEQELYAIGRDVTRKEQEISEIDSKLAKEEGRDARHRIANRRLQVARETKELVKAMRELFECKFRSDLNDRMARLFREISVVPYSPHISDQYEIQLLDETSDTKLAVATSQGESQILALCFIASVIEQTKEYNKSKDALPGPDSSVLPVVMDSPFGSLDPAHRRQVATFLPKIANQVVTMLTETQYRGEVQESLRGRIGKTYVMTYFTPREDVDEVTTSIEGRSYCLVKRSLGDYEYTEIREVQDA